MGISDWGLGKRKADPAALSLLRPALRYFEGSRPPHIGFEFRMVSSGGRKGRPALVFNLGWSDSAAVKAAPHWFSI